MEAQITTDQIAAMAKTHGEHIATLKAYAAQKPESAVLIGFTITAITGAKEALDGHLNALAAKAASDAKNLAAQAAQ